MTDALRRIEQRQDDFVRRLDSSDRVNADHREDDAKSFRELHSLVNSTSREVMDAIKAMQTTFNGKIEDVKKELEELTSKVNPLEAANLKSEGYREGFAAAKRPNPWLLQIAPVVVAVVLAALGSWIAHDYYSPARELKTTATTTSVTVDGTHK